MKSNNINKKNTNRMALAPSLLGTVGLRPSVIRLLLLLLLLPSCSEDFKEIDKGSIPLTLNVSETELEINQYMDDKTALSFEWTSGSNQGTNAAISYLFEMDLKGNNFNGGIKHEVGKTDSRIITFTHKELNDTVLNIWRLPMEQEAEFEARISATSASANVEKQISEIISFKLIPYKSRLLNLWMIGDATLNGWDSQKATPMNPDYEIKGRFTWTGLLIKGEMKFLTQLGVWFPSLNRDVDDDTKLVYRMTEEDPDEKFVIPFTGTYSIELNVDNMTISIVNESREAPFNEVWLMGDATSAQWNWAEVVKLAQDEEAKHEFTYEGRLTPGYIKFPIELNEDWNGKFIIPTQPNAPITEGNYRVVARVDNRWRINQPGSYRILIDALEERVYFTLLEAEQDPSPHPQIWMIGDATSGEWSWDHVTEMQRNRDNLAEFIYEGHLNAGEIKFPVEIDHDWNGDFIVANYPNAPITENSYQVATGIDNKWKIEEAGEYRIMINTANQSINFTRK